MRQAVSIRATTAVAAAALGVAALTAPRSLDQAVTASALASSEQAVVAPITVHTATPLRTGYRLPVTAVVPVPPVGVAPGNGTLSAEILAVAQVARQAVLAGQLGCPLGVRGVVQGEDGGGFAVVAVGDKSQVLHQGERIIVAGAWYAVSRIEQDHIILRQADSTVRCALL